VTLDCSTPIRSTQSALLRDYGGRVPRYTSYPPATQFGADVDAEVYGAWLGELPAGAPVSLYVHVPFCRRLCWFCGCHSRVVRHARSVSAYVERLRDEIALIEARLPGKLKAEYIHLGGGTPNLLSVDDLRVLFETIRQVFRVPVGAEISAEIDPLHLTQDWVRAARFHGAPTRRDCPICRRCQLTLLRYVYSDELGQYSGRLRTAGEVVSMSRQYGRLSVYVVEVCQECAWNHLVASFVVGDGQARRPPRRVPTVEDRYG